MNPDQQLLGPLSVSILKGEPMSDEKKQPWIVCAAIHKRGNIICGVRHFDGIMRATLNATGETHVGWDQGFVDQFGTFYSREDAWKIADKNGQIRRPTGLEDFAHSRPANVGDEGMLFSENLY
jgi:hypothetical protein